MLLDILRELISNVRIETRKEIADLLADMNNPPQELVSLLSEDIVEVSAPLLERAVLPDEQLMHLARYGSEAHRRHIGRRFGLSPLIRQELSHQEQKHSEQVRHKLSLSELEQREADREPELDESMTASILEMVKAQNIHGQVTLDEDILKPGAADRKRGDTTGPATPERQERSTPKPKLVLDNKLAFSEDVPSFLKQKKEPEEQTGSGADAEDEQQKATHISMAALSKAIFNLEEEARLAMSFGKNTRAETERHPEDIQEHPHPVGDVANDLSGQESEVRAEEVEEEPEETPAQALHQQTLRSKDYVRATADWFWEINRMGTIKFLSEEAFTAFGRPANSMIGEDFIEMCEVLPEQNGDLSFESLFERRTPFRDETFLIRSEGGDSTKWLLSGIAVFDIQTGRFTGYRGSARAAETSSDMLPLSRTETAGETPPAPTPVPQKHPAATSGKDTGGEKEDHIASELLQNLSHEFRTPLNAIIGFSEMIDMEAWGPVNEQYREHTKSILSAANLLKDAVNDVLDSAKLDSGLIEITPESFSLKSIIDDCAEKIAPLAQSKKVKFRSSSDNIDVILYNDRQCLEMCLSKMISSAMKKAHEGDIMNLSVMMNSNAQVRIEVPLLGQKIAEKDAKNLFQKVLKSTDESENIKNSKKNPAPRLAPGYGLSVARDLARLIGGDLSCHCQDGYVQHLVLTISNYPHTA
ncbi:sensor histidine kinase [Emcibacter sp.]|uniref:sensor histidine kinase n=1 Tax=Emcibacter sp. TaxID=1979954 RepID=UPI002AA5F79A|nr:histidine kinase dimerization/phospho-acceptor domain-containing protein [Emcibacter sp.]